MTASVIEFGRWFQQAIDLPNGPYTMEIGLFCLRFESIYDTPNSESCRLHTKVFCFLDHYELIVANFQIQIIISTFADIVHLLGGNKHGIYFSNI